MPLYKIYHRPTGMFFKPSKHGSKSNLSKKGKIYDRRPSLKYLGNVYHHPLTKEEKEAFRAEVRGRPFFSSYNSEHWQGYESRVVVEQDWEIVEIHTD